MLLKVDTPIYDNETVLSVWKVGGDHHTYRRPFDPYFYLRRPLSLGVAEVVTRSPLSTLKPEQMYKIGFPNVRLLKDVRVPDGIEDGVPYDQRVAIDLGFKAESPPPSHDAFDMEWEDKITAISYFGKGIAECKTKYDLSESDLIKWLLTKIRERNPDCIDTYWGSFADWIKLIERAKVNHIRLAVGRDGSEPYVIRREFHSGKRIGEDIIIDLGGRVHFDVWKEVDGDQTLFGIKNKQLKTVAEYYKLGEIIRVDYLDMPNLNAAELSRYCLNDARLTYELAKIYIRNLIPLTEELKIAFNMCVERSPSHPSNYVLMQEFHELGIVVDANNMERYPQFVSEGRKSYQGALIDLFKPGVYENFRKLDFKGMYPSNMMCFNYSPESLLDVHIHEGESLPNGRIVDFKENKISIQDKYLGIITIKVDLTHDSVSRKKMKTWKAWREDIKKEIKVASPEQKVGLNSRQWMIKVVMNAMTGYHGMGFAGCGCFPIAAHITGHGRWQITEATEFLLREGEIPIERDTDGIYYVGEADYAPDITDLIRKLIPQQFDASVIEVENEDFAAGIFYEEKGYVLKTNEGKLIFHGSGLKGHHIPNLCDKGLETVVTAIFDKENIVSALNQVGQELKGLSQSDFIMTAELKKKPDEYSDKNQYGKLIQKLKNANLIIRWGDEIQYVKTTDNGFLPLNIPVRRFNLDLNYYYGRLADVLERVLHVSHGYNSKQIKTCLKGGKIECKKKGFEQNSF